MTSLFQRFRRNGIRQSKSILASVADVVSDWIFYLNVKDNAALNDKYGFYLFIFACISSGLLLVLSLSFLVSARAHTRSRSSNSNSTRSLTDKFAPFGRCLKMLLGLQILVEDIPQFVLGALVRAERDGIIDPYLVFTWTTSGFNFLLNLLDMIEIEDQDDIVLDNGGGGDDRDAATESDNQTIRATGGGISVSHGYDYEKGHRTAQLY